MPFMRVSGGGGCTKTEEELGVGGGWFAPGALRRSEFCEKGVALGTPRALTTRFTGLTGCTETETDGALWACGVGEDVLVF